MMKNVKNRKAASSGQRRRGAVLIEFAACVIMLLFLLIGTLEFGWMTRNKLIIANAAREGARVASLGRPRDQILTRVRNSTKLLGVTDANIVLSQSTDDGATFTAFPADNTTPTPDQNGVQPGRMIRVTINITNKSIAGTPIFRSRPINSEAIMVWEDA